MTDTVQQPPVCACGHAEKDHAWDAYDEEIVDVGCLEQLCKCQAYRPVQLAPPPAPAPKRPRIICLCGSTRFIEQFAVKTWELEREGFIVLGCTLLPPWYCNVPDHFGEATGTKEQCDELHLRKIDLADEVLVLNIGGYIGESTRQEIEYATAIGKPVNYVEEQTDG